MEIATAFVAIRPQTDGFEGEVTSALAGGDPVEVPVIAETGDAEEQIGSLDGEPVEVPVDADVSGAEADLSSLEAEPVDVPVDADVSAAEGEIGSLGGETIDISVNADTSSAQQGVGDLSGSIGDLASTVGDEGGGGAAGMIAGFSETLAGLAPVTLGATAAVGALAAVIADVTQSYGEAQVVQVETASMLDSLGDEAATSAGHIGALSQSIMEYSGYSDEAVQQGANTLLMFDNINSQPVFDRALNDSADLARKLRTDVPTAARMLGMALQDPEHGMNRLKRAGVDLSESQKATIAAMMETGDVAGAQEVIFDELEGKIGNLAEDYGETLPGEIDKTSESIDEMKESLGALAAPFIVPAVGMVTSSANTAKAAIDGIGGALGLVDDKAEESTRTFSDLGAVSSDWLFGAGHASDFLADHLGEVDGEASDAEQAISDLSQAIDDYINGIVSIPSAQRELRQSFADLAEANVSGTWDDQAEAMEDVITSTANLVQTQADLGMSTETMNATLYGAIATVNQMHDAGQITDEEFARLSAQIAGIPVPDPITTSTNAPETEGAVKSLGDAIEKVPDSTHAGFTDNASDTQGHVDSLGAAARMVRGDYWMNFHISIGEALNTIDTLRNAAASVKSIIEVGAAQGADVARPTPTNDGGGTIVVQTRLDGAVIAESVHRHNGYALVAEGYEP